MIVLNDKNLSDIPTDLQRVPIVVNPRDCVTKTIYVVILKII